MIDGRDLSLSKSLGEISCYLCHRKFGVGADGVIFIQEYDGYDFNMLYYNADGTGPVMCGNGGRASLLFVHDNKICVKENYYFRAADGDHYGKVVNNGEISVTIKSPQHLRKIKVNGKIAFLVDTGVPHIVMIEKNVDKIDVNTVALAIRREYNANVNFIEEVSNGIWAIRTHERGVEAETLACGTGAVASSLVVTRFCGCNFPIVFNAKGGMLTIMQEDANLWLKGPVKKVFEGDIFLKI
jgi:diaminopimelate epimerase